MATIAIWKVIINLTTETCYAYLLSVLHRKVCFCWSYFYLFGKPTRAITSFALASFSGNKFFPLNFSRDLSILTMGVLLLFNFSIVVMPQIYYIFLLTKNASYSLPFSNSRQVSSLNPNISKSDKISSRFDVIPIL